LLQACEELLELRGALEIDELSTHELAAELVTFEQTLPVIVGFSAEAVLFLLP
jgi:hypothetical protein